MTSVMDKMEIQLGCPANGEPYTAMKVTDRQAVLELFDECKKLQHKQGIKQDYAFEITMPCGHKTKFKEHSDIPTEDLPCPCGRKGHYLIRYERSKK